MKPTPISVEVIAATRPLWCNDKGLVTLQVEYPLFIHTELLTHRRFSRNASSGRAMSTKRYSDMGYYLPDTWYAQGNGMQAGKAITDTYTQQEANNLYHTVYADAVSVAEDLTKYGVAKEQANRLIPPTKIVRAIITGTQDGWKSFLTLRNHPAADTAMQKFAQLVQQTLESVQWVHSDAHIPFQTNPDEPLWHAIAKLARVSYNREKGKDDKALCEALFNGGHFSPFEHIAVWQYNPELTNYTNSENDVEVADNREHLQWFKRDYFGWEHFRATLTQRYQFSNFIDALSMLN
jgi:thymidylate synthase ThyX